MKPIIRLNIYAFAHFAVDLACFYALFSRVTALESSAALLLLYNVLAFGAQPLFGLVCDRLNDARPPAVLGAALCAFGVLLCPGGLALVLLIGLGNALFHVSGAVGALRRYPGNAFYAGIYVGSGALGTVCGTLIAQCGWAYQLIGLLLLAAMGAIWLSGRGAPRGSIVTELSAGMPVEQTTIPALALCLMAIALRSFAGYTVDLPAGDGVLFVLMPGIMGCLGKIFGGIGGSLFRWRSFGAASIVVAGALCCIAPDTPFALMGVFFFNFAMPLTLCTVMCAYPARIGFSFGLTTLALLAGTLPFLFLPADHSFSPALTAALMAVAALLVYYGMKHRDNDMDAYIKTP